jgi:hypothetical protein
MNPFFDLLRSDGSIVINKRLAKSIGLHEAILYAELLSRHNYFLIKEKLTEDGFFYNTVEDLEYGTTLSEKQQRNAIKKLISIGLIEYKVQGLPAKRYFKIIEDEQILIKYIKNNPESKEQSKNGKNGGTTKVKMAELDRQKWRTNNTNINNTNTNNKTTKGNTSDVVCQEKNEKKEKEKSITKKPKTITLQKDIQDIKKRIEDRIKSTIPEKTVQTLIDKKGVEVINRYIDNWDKFNGTTIGNVTGFFVKAVLEGYSIIKSCKPSSWNNKPAQATNYTQRIYDDSFFDNLFVNIRQSSKEGSVSV